MSDELLTRRVRRLEATLAAVVLGGFAVAGDGLISSGTTVGVAANADGSIVVNANDIQVGVLATDAQHGNRGGGSLHANAVAGGAAGFLSGADKTKLDGIATGATAEVDADATHSGRVNLSAQTLGAGTKTVDGLAVTGSFTAEAGRIISLANGVLQTLQVDTGGVDVGYVKFSNPGARPGISARNLDGTGRSDIRQRSGGGWEFAGQSGGSDAIVPAVAFIMDGPNKRFGIGVTPTSDLHNEVASSAGGGVQWLARNTTSNGLTQILVRDDGTNTGGLEIIGSSFATTARPTTRGMVLLRAGANSQGLALQAAATSTPIEFWTNNAGTHAKRAEITGAGVFNYGGVEVLSQTNTVSSITNKSFSSMTHSGTLALGTSSVTGSWSFSGTPTIGGNATLSGNLSLSGTATFSNKQVHAVQTSITAFAGGGQASATALTGEHCYVTTVATAADSVKLPVAVAGYEVAVFNLGANSMNVFPQTGSDAGAGLNTAVAIAAGSSKVFYAQTTTQWRNR